MSTELNNAENGAARLEALAAATEKVETVAKVGESLESIGKTMIDIQELIENLQGFAEVGAVLEVVSVGIGVMRLALGLESIESVILDQVIEVNEKVDGLNRQINLLFDRMNDEVMSTSAKAALQQHIEKIQAAKGLLVALAENRNKPGGPDAGLIAQTEDRLADVDQNGLQEAVQSIADHCLGSALAPNILDLTYKLNYGNADDVLQLAVYLVQMANLAAAADASISTVKARRKAETDGTPFGETEAAEQAALLCEIYDKPLKAIAGAADLWLQKCIDPALYAAEIERCFRDTADEHFGFVSADDVQGSADRVHALLKPQWPALNFSVLTYPNLIGEKQHFVISTPGRVVSIFHYQPPSGDKMNVVIYFPTRTKTTLPVTINYEQAAAPIDPAVGRHAEAVAITAIIGLDLDASSKTHADIELKPIAALHVDGPKHGDLLWIGFHELHDQGKVQNFGLLAGLASDNWAYVHTSKVSRLRGLGIDNESGYDVMMLIDDTDA